MARYIDAEPIMKLNSCTKCGGKIKLYICNGKDTYNCFARCENCKTEYPMPEAHLVVKGTRIYMSSIKKAERCWNKRADAYKED